MDIYLANERAFHLFPQITLEVARDRLEQKKVNLVSGTVGALISRPKPEDIQLVSVQSRLEAFWQISVFLHTTYLRNAAFTVPVSGVEVQSVTALGQELPVSLGIKGTASFSFTGVEHCLEESRRQFTLDGNGAITDPTKYQSFAKSEIPDLAQFNPEGVLVVPPKARATTVMRTVLGEVIKPVKADVIEEEKVTVEALDVNFRPVYAFEYSWAAKNKKSVIEFDALTGEIHTGGSKVEDAIKGILTEDVLFDVTSTAAGMLVPGGSIAVRLVRATLDYKKK